MLERHEQEALAQIEAHLHAEDPHLSEALDAGVAPVQVHPILRSVAVLTLALVITTGATVLVGPDLGGFLAVITLSYAAMYAWGALRVCKGTSGR